MSTWKNILTFGAYARVEERLNRYNETYQHLESVLETFDTAQSEAYANVCFLIHKRQQAMERVKLIANSCEQSLKVLNQDYFIRTELNDIAAITNCNYLDGNTILKQTIEKIPVAAAIGMTASGATFLISNALHATGTTKLGLATIGSFKATAFSAVALKGGTSAATVGLAKGSLAATKLGLATMGSIKAGGAAAATIGLIALPITLLVSGAFSHWSADKQIANIDKEERNLIDMSEKYTDLTKDCYYLSRRSEELGNGIKNITRNLYINYIAFKLFIALVIFAKFIERKIKVPLFSMNMLEGVKSKINLINAEIESSIISIQIPIK